MKKIALIVLPTYNERSNITEVLNRLFAHNLKGELDYSIQVLVVDDQSPDGTGEVVEILRDNYPGTLHLITAKKAGLGAAYKRGFRYALENLDFDVILQMDADLSHDPDEVPKLLEKIDEGFDVVIGSRYVDGGLIPGNWPIFRILNSKGAHFVARYVGGISSEVHELTGGFKAMTKRTLTNMPLSSARLSGYGIQLFLSNEFEKQNLKVIEVPISFRDRKAGESKMKTKDIFEFIQIAWNLNNDSSFKRLLRAVIIGLFGILNTVGMAQLMVGASINNQAVAAISVGILSMIPFLLLEQRSIIASSRAQQLVFNTLFVGLLSPFLFSLIRSFNLSVLTITTAASIVGLLIFAARSTGLIKPISKVIST